MKKDVKIIADEVFNKRMMLLLKAARYGHFSGKLTVKQLKELLDEMRDVDGIISEFLLYKE